MASAWSPQELEQLRLKLEQGTQDGSDAKGIETQQSQDGQDQLEHAADAAIAEMKAEMAVVVAAPPAAPEAPAVAPVPEPQLLALERLFLGLASAPSSQVAKLLGRVAEVFGSIENASLRRAIQDKVLSYFDATARRIKDAQPAALEAFVVSVAEALRGTGMLEAHPLAALVESVLKARRKAVAVEHEVASIASDESSDPSAQADKIVKKITGRLDGATKIVATRMLGAEVDAKSSAFCARFDNRVLGANLSVLERFETAVSLPEKFFDFDERFKIAASIFPGGIAGSDGEDALGGLGKFAWVLGADIATQEGYKSLLSEEEALAFAEAQTRYAEDEIEMGAGDFGAGGYGAGALGDLGGLGKSVGLAGFSLDKMSRFISVPAAPKLSSAGLPSSKLSADLGRTATYSPAPGYASSLPKAAVAAIRSGNIQALNLSLGGNVPAPRLESLMSLRSMPSFAAGATRGASGVGALSHVAMGFQSVAGAQASSSALRSVEKLSFGGMGMKGGPTSFGYVSSPSTSYATLPLAKLEATGAIPAGLAPASSVAGVQALETRLMPAARRSLGVAQPSIGLAQYAGVPSTSFVHAGAPKLDQIRAATSVARRAALAGTPAYQAASMASGAAAADLAMPSVAPAAALRAPSAAKVSAYAISSDSFGVPRYRGAQQIPLAALAQLPGLDLSGTAIAGPSRSSSISSSRTSSLDFGSVPDVRTPGIRIRPPSGVISEVAPNVRVSGLENVAHVMPSAPRHSAMTAGAAARFGYTRDDFGITRIQSLGRSERTALMPRSADMGGLDLATAGVTFSGLDLAGGTAALNAPAAAAPAAVGRNIPWMQRLQQGGGLSASSVLGAETLRASLRQQAAAGAGHALALGPVELAFPAGQMAPAASQVIEGGAPAPMMLPSGPVSPTVARRVRGAALRHAGMAAAPASRAPRAVRSRGRFVPAMPAAIPAHQAMESGYAAPSAASIRLGAAPARTVLGSLPGDLAHASAETLRPMPVEKYYAAVSSPKLALGSIGGFQLPSFGGGSAPSHAPPAMLDAGPAGSDFSPLSLQRLTGVSMGAAPVFAGMQFNLPEGGSYDAAGFAPTARMGGAAHTAAGHAGMANERYDRVGRDVQSLRANYSGAKLWSGGLSAAAPEMLDLRLAAAADVGAVGGFSPAGQFGGMDLSGAALPGGKLGGGSATDYALPSLGADARVPVAIKVPGGGTQVVEVPAAELASMPGAGLPSMPEAPTSKGSLGWRAVRPTAPRVQGVYGGPAEQALGARDVLGLSSMGGFDAAHMPSAVNPRLATLGLDADLAPTIDRVTSRGKAIDPLTARALKPVLGEAIEDVKLVRGPEATAVARALGTPALAAGGTVVLSDEVDLGTRRGMSVLAHEARHARTSRAPVHRFVDKLGMPGEAEARASGEAAAHIMPPVSGEGQVFGLVPKTVRGRFADRFALDGWTEGDMRYSGGGIDAGMKLREANRGLDLSVDHEFVRFAGDITQLPAAALPVDLTSQLQGRGEIVARSQQSPAALGFAPRGVEMPLKAVFWGRKGGDRVARGGLEVREVALPSRFTTLDPTRIEGALALEGAEGVLPASYRLQQGVRPAGAADTAAPAGQAQAPRALRQQPDVVRQDVGEIKIGGRFAEKSTTVRTSGEFAADLTKSKSFVESIAPSAETLPKNAEFLAATGIDPDSASRLVDGNRQVASNLRASYVRRGGLPSASDWALSVNVGGEAPAGVPADAGAMALSFKRASGPAEEHVAPTSRIGRRVKSEAGKPLSSPVLDFMERFFKRDLTGVRVNDGQTAKELNKELGSEAFAAGNQVYVGTPKGTSDEQLATLGHEIAHVLNAQAGGSRPAAPRQVPARNERRPASGNANPSGNSSAQERRAREAERQIRANLRNQPKERRAPKLPMTHTRGGSQAEVEDARAPIQKKKAADTSMQMFEKSGAVLPKPWEALFPRPPKRDITPLVYQIWNKIKKDLQVENERRSGGF